MLVIDTDSNVSGHIPLLKSKGVGVVGRYFSASSWKRISKSEAREIAAGGLKLFTVFENNGDPTLDGDAGTSGAQLALQQARRSVSHRTARSTSRSSTYRTVIRTRMFRVS